MHSGMKKEELCKFIEQKNLCLNYVIERGKLPEFNEHHSFGKFSDGLMVGRLP